MKKKRKVIYIIIGILVLVLVWLGQMLWVAAGQLPKGERLARCEHSPQWKDGEFKNELETPALTSNEGTMAALWKFFFKNIPDLTPSKDVPLVKTDLKSIPREKEVVVWLGHSSVFIQMGGKRFLFDPVLTNKLPVWLFMRPFKGADGYTPDDIPDVDYLIITHDHWDHLDYKTVKALKDRVGTVVCGLGVGQHFAYWGYDEAKIKDVDWGDSVVVNRDMKLRCLPTRHFSGRLFGRNKALWASYLIDGKRRIFVSGDGGYDPRFKKIGEKYPNIDLAIMENGQYDKDWKYIHTMPDELPRAINEINPKRVMTYHNSKYALANHKWTEPMDNIYKHAQNQAWQLLTPHIGEPLWLDKQQRFKKWW